MNNKGPRTDPWGTPVVISFILDRHLSISFFFGGGGGAGGGGVFSLGMIQTI